MIDLRSDTVTRPTPEMLQAMVTAPVGDDVIDIDPTVAALQELTAKVLGKEAAIFMPSGSMTNQIALRVHCSPGDEFLCEEYCHIYNYEQAAFAQLSALVARTIPGEYGVLEVDQLRNKIRPENEHMVRTRLLCLENTHNRGGGKIWPYQQLEDACTWARDNGLKTHLDGARLFNAVVATGIDAKTWSDNFDTVSVCFSKGLGAPVGSCLAGSKVDILKARRARKLFGGGMRQAGIIAAGALYGLQHNIERLSIDHNHARQLGEAVRDCDGLTLVPEIIETNIVIFNIAPQLGSSQVFLDKLQEKGVRAMGISPVQIRMVTHLDVSSQQISKACDAIREVHQSLNKNATLCNS